MWPSVVAISLVLSPLPGAEPTPNLVVKPQAHRTLVNPPCSHCRDEAKRRASQLRADDPVLSWVRGKYDGGAVPVRFFLNPYRVISDTYGVFVYDPDAGFARGFAPSLDFTFYGWRNGVMVMKHKDGTLYSCLTGLAFAGPRQGHRLTLLPTLTSRWGFWLKHYPGTVAYHMFDKYQPVELPTTVSAASRASRRPTVPRLPADDPVLGVAIGTEARAYPAAPIEQAGLVHDRLGGKKCDILWFKATGTAAAFEPIASAARRSPPAIDLVRDSGEADAPFVDRQTGSRWDISGRATRGPLKGWTLRWLDGTQVKWYAWAAEYPRTSVYAGRAQAPARPRPAVMIAGTAEMLAALPKHFARVIDADVRRRQITLTVEGESLPKVWQLRPDAEVRVAGWWGRLDQMRPGEPSGYGSASIAIRNRWASSCWPMSSAPRPSMAMASRSKNGTGPRSPSSQPRAPPARWMRPGPRSGAASTRAASMSCGRAKRCTCRRGISGRCSFSMRPPSRIDAMPSRARCGSAGASRGYPAL